MLHVSTIDASNEMTQSKQSSSPMRLSAQRLSPSAATLQNFNGPLRNPSMPVLQRKCDCSGGDCSNCVEEEKPALQRRAANHSDPNVVPPIVHEVLQSGGHPLDAGTRAFMEPRFGHDFSNVRVHSDAQAARSARAVNAFAYTVENHIVLGTGHYSPQTTSTKRLLAHELAHVVQQRNGGAFQPSAISSPGDGLEQQAARAEEAIMSDRPAPPLSDATNTVQRQKGDPLTDPFGEGKTEEKEPELDPKTKQVYEACPTLCRKFPPVEIAPGAFVAVCDDSVLMRGPDVRTVGCTPNRQGNVGFFAGTPAWQLPPKADTCNFDTCKFDNARPTAGIQIGYIQTVENCLSGGVYFQRDASGKWVWAGNKWWCVRNSRDGQDNSTAPWYGDSKGGFGPQPYQGACPALTDTPNVVVPARQNTIQIAPGVQGGGNPLRRLRIDGNFHLWLVAKPPKGPLVFIHHWSFRCWVVAELGADDADPCNTSQWVKMNMNSLVASGPGAGSATAVLTGNVANKTKTDCSTP